MCTAGAVGRSKSKEEKKEKVGEEEKALFHVIVLALGEEYRDLPLLNELLGYYYYYLSSLFVYYY